MVSADAPITKVIPAYELALKPSEIPSFSVATADPIVRIVGPANRPQVNRYWAQSAVENLHIECPQGPYFPTRLNKNDGTEVDRGFPAAVVVEGFNGAEIAAPLDDVTIRDLEIDGCPIGIYTVNAHNTTIAGNKLPTGVRLFGEATISFLDTPFQRISLLAVESRLRQVADNAIRVHGTLDHSIRIADNVIGSPGGGGGGDPSSGPIRGIHVHGTNRTGVLAQTPGVLIS